MFVCLVAGALRGNIAESLTAALGALLIGLLQHREPCRQQAETMLISLAVMIPVIVLAAFTSEPVWLRMLGAAVESLACGLAAAWGPGLGMAATLALARFAVYSGSAMACESVLRRAAAFAAGGLLQLAILLSGWVLQRGGDARPPIADAWRAVGHAAQRGPRTRLAATSAEATERALRGSTVLPAGTLGAAELARLARDADIVRESLAVGVSRAELGEMTTSRAASASGSTARTDLPEPYVSAVVTACLRIGLAVPMRRAVMSAAAAGEAAQRARRPSS